MRWVECAVGGFIFCDPARFIFNGGARIRINTLTHGCNTRGIVVMCKNNSIMQDNLLSEIGRSLRRTNITCYRVKNIRPGPVSKGMCRNVRLYHHRRISVVLPIKNNSIVSATGTVTTKTLCSNSF